MPEIDEEAVLKRGYAETLAEWYFLIDHHWEGKNKLRELIAHYGRTGDAIKAARYREDRNDSGRLWLILQRTWEGLPEAGWIHGLEGFYPLCDLCSDFPTGEEGSVKT